MPSRADPSKSVPVRFPPSRRARAYHEAGHAVVAEALGVPVELVTIRPTGPVMAGGIVSRGELSADQVLELAASVAGHPTRGSEEAMTEAEAWREVRVALAGPAAQARAMAAPYDLDGSGRGDLARASDLLLFRLGTSLTDIGAALSRELAITGNVLAGQWTAVEAVAAELLEAGTIRRPRIMRLLGEVSAMPAGVPGPV